MATKVLIVDDDASQLRYFSTLLGSLGYETEIAGSGREALERLGEARPHGIALCLLDLNMPDPDGIAVLETARERQFGLPIIALTSDGSVSRAVQAMQAGAVDFLVKPCGPERLDVSIRNALSMSRLTGEVQRLSRKTENRLGFDDLVAVSPATRQAIALARRAARTDIPVLIEGESGTGKEVFARAIHGESERAGKPFVAVNCGALPANLVESILFGHEKGAFTGAVARRAGKFQEASGGTLFLDEIGELPLYAQVKLLRAIQTGEVDPVGSPTSVETDIRLISATNRDLGALIRKGGFREDLYYRISVFPLTLPPLRTRREDIPGLARRFLDRRIAEGGVSVETFSQAAMEVLARAPWPGNVRELENTIQRGIVLADGRAIEPRDLQGLPRPAEPASPGLHPAPYTNGRENHVGQRSGVLVGDDGHVRRLYDIEKDAIRLALRVYRGRMAETARRLGIGRSTLYRKLDELQIDKDAP